MSKQYTVAKGQTFYYPADLVSHQLIKTAGGLSKLSDAERLNIKYKTVTEGQRCDDMPKSILDLYASRGWVLESIIEDTPKVIHTIKKIEEKEEETL